MIFRILGMIFYDFYFPVYHLKVFLPSPCFVSLFLFYYNINNSFSLWFQILALSNKSLWYPYDYSLVIFNNLRIVICYEIQCCAWLKKHRLFIYSSVSALAECYLGQITAFDSKRQHDFRHNYYRSNCSLANGTCQSAQTSNVKEPAECRACSYPLMEIHCPSQIWQLKRLGF